MGSGESERRKDPPDKTDELKEVEDRPDEQDEDRMKTNKTGTGEEMAGAVGRQLKATYGKLLKEPVPKRFLDLLDQLEQRNSGARQARSEKGNGEN
ncbi:MAG: NepR family anti-sigma factor [Hyphomicrobiaceae bacterium]